MGLLGQSRETWNALEADLLSAGYTLDDYPHRLSLRAICQFMFWADQNRSALARLVRPATVGWNHAEELLACILETLQSANWQRQGNKTAPKPKPITRPGAEPQGIQRFGADGGVSIGEFERRMRERNVA